MFILASFKSYISKYVNGFVVYGYFGQISIILLFQTEYVCLPTFRCITVVLSNINRKLLKSIAGHSSYAICAAHWDAT